MPNELKLLFAELNIDTHMPDQAWAITRGWRELPHRSASCVLDGNRAVSVNCHESDEMDFDKFVRVMRDLHPSMSSVGVLVPDPGTSEVLHRHGLSHHNVGLLSSGELVVPAQAEYATEWLKLIRCAAQMLNHGDVVYI